MEFEYNDGGRAIAGYKGSAGDCVARSIAIVGEMPYEYVYQSLASGMAKTRKTKKLVKAGKRSARNGIYVKTKWFKEMMELWGFKWTPTMQIGSGCRVHLTPDELPKGRLVVALSRHYTAVIDGVIQDTFDPNDRPVTTYFNRDGSVAKVTGEGPRCVYGYWRLEE